MATTVAHSGDIGIYVNALGVVTPRNTVSVKTRVDGQLVKVNYQEGQMVRAGDPLVEIDTAPFQAALVQAEGQFARDTALLDNAHLDLDRYKEAVAKNAIPKQQLDTQVATVHQYEGTVKLDQGQVDNAKVQLPTGSPTAQKSRFVRRPTQRAGLRRRTKLKGIRRELNRSKQRKQRKETSVVSVFLPLKSWPMHPLYQKAAGLTETIIAAAIEVHHSDNVPNQKLGKWLK